VVESGLVEISWPHNLFGLIWFGLELKWVWGFGQIRIRLSKSRLPCIGPQGASRLPGDLDSSHLRAPPPGAHRHRELAVLLLE
jgi:hypothetical protein